jgi:hypothetical protein
MASMAARLEAMLTCVYISMAVAAVLWPANFCMTDECTPLAAASDRKLCLSSWSFQSSRP